MADKCKRCNNGIPRGRRNSDEFCSCCEESFAKEASLLAVGLAIKSESYDKLGQEFEDLLAEIETKIEQKK
jgi:hypothetical protein